MKHLKLKFFLLSFFLLSFLFISAISCQKSIYVENDINYSDTNFVTEDWTAATHSNSAQANFDEIFDDTQVKRIDIVITPERWQTMLDDMTEKYGEFGIGQSGPPTGPQTNIDGEAPIFVPAEIFYNEKEWYRVGIRFKGNSSLTTSWESGIMKLSFKIDFDKFEDEYSQIKDQRFYGFKELSLKNNYNDKSFLREKVCADIFRNAGLVSPHAAFYTLYVDYGDGPIYFGLYTLVEQVDNTVIQTQYTSSNGNLYKPENEGASFTLGSFNEEDFEKKTNEKLADWSDIQNLFSILHDNSRTSNPEQWRTNLNSIFNTDVFMKYLAINTTIQNWDTYGIMTHNYYLYNNPENNKLEWIPWDNNEALQEGKMQGSLALNFFNLQASYWPLIGYLYNDSYYKTLYDNYLQETISTVFEPNAMKELYSNYESLIEQYATSELDGYTFLTNSSEFQIAINELKQHVDDRKTAVEDYLNN